nr:MAG TPA: Minor capsid protein from bacteriophage [Caudoviricetes sp.]
MSEDRIPLKIADAENAYIGILELVQQYPQYGDLVDPNREDAVVWNGLTEDTCIGIFPLQGAYYIKKYVSGSYIAQMPFQMAFKCAPTSNRGSIECQNMLDDLAKWMEQNAFTVTDKHFALESIARTSPVIGDGRDTQNTTYAVNMQLRFSYRR